MSNIIYASIGLVILFTFPFIPPIKNIFKKYINDKTDLFFISSMWVVICAGWIVSIPVSVLILCVYYILNKIFLEKE
jgi:hypothetical protein